MRVMTEIDTNLGEDDIRECLGLGLELVANRSVADEKVLNRPFERRSMMYPERGYLENTTVRSVHLEKRRSW